MTSKDLIETSRSQMREIIIAAVNAACEKGELLAGEIPNFMVEIPGDTSHGDFATNIAMVTARLYRKSPAKIAEIILENLNLQNSCFDQAQVAGPGFINFFLKKSWFTDVIITINSMQENYGKTDYGKGKKVMVEFVSANPTGPMHMGNARGGAIGDVLAAAIEACGHEITREFYINDAGNQIEKFGKSLEIRYLQILNGVDSIEFPEDGYQGEDIIDCAQQYIDKFGDILLAKDSEQRRAELANYILPRNIDDLKKGLSLYRIDYDVWFRESSLYEDGTVQIIMDKLKQRDLTYEKDGAIWYKATEFGSEKDEVLIRANGNATYFAADIAYHYNKFAIRGHDTVIDVWGADHHGHVARIKGAMDAVGLDGSKLHIVLMQLVRLMKDGEPYRMSKRSGRSITLIDLLEEVPIDAARFFFNMNSPGSSMDFDLDLAIKQSTENPVYYVQYAHARICSIISKLAEEGINPRACSQEELLALNTAEEIQLIRCLAALPSEIIGATTRLDPACLTHYAINVATIFHRFYTNCRVKSEDEPLMQARLMLIECTKITIANTLKLLKISAPYTM